MIIARIADLTGTPVAQAIDMKPTADHLQRFTLAFTVAIAVVVIPAPASGATADSEAAQRPTASLFRSEVTLPNSSAASRRFTLLNARPLWVDDAPHPPPHRSWRFAADPRRWPRLFANTTESTLSFDPILRRHR
jgi:hypothetical protein